MDLRFEVVPAELHNGQRTWSVWRIDGVSGSYVGSGDLSFVRAVAKQHGRIVGILRWSRTPGGPRRCFDVALEAFEEKDMAHDPRTTHGVPLYCSCCGAIYDSSDLLTETCPSGCVQVTGSRVMPVSLQQVGEDEAKELTFGCD